MQKIEQMRPIKWDVFNGCSITRVHEYKTHYDLTLERDGNIRQSRMKKIDLVLTQIPKIRWISLKTPCKCTI